MKTLPMMNTPLKLLNICTEIYNTIIYNICYEKDGQGNNLLNSPNSLMFLGPKLLYNTQS